MFSIRFFDISDRVFSRLLRWNTVNTVDQWKLWVMLIERYCDERWCIWCRLDTSNELSMKKIYDNTFIFRTTERGYSITDNFIIEAGNGCNFYWTKFSPLFNIASTHNTKTFHLCSISNINLTWNECVCMWNNPIMWNTGNSERMLSISFNLFSYLDLT